MNGGIIVENIEKPQHTYFNENTTNESASMACSNVGPYKTAVKAGHLERMKKDVWTPLR